MKREADLIDVWFDSGAMPYAQWHYPFENKNYIEKNSAFPADFIAEGVDQTRGWFYTLHTVATLVFDSVAYKNVVSNGLVLDKNGQKMSKRLGNAVDPFETLKTYGADATRWYMITNAQPWDNLKFDLEGITEVQRKFFRALNSTYSFYALYANVDNFTFSEKEIPLEQRPEIDRWVISRLNTLIKEVDAAYNDYEPTKVGRLIQDFVTDELSNWYVRLCRRRFWKGDYSEDKIAAYQTLYTCLETIAKLASPIAPFYSEQLFRDLNSVTKKDSNESVHLTLFPEYNEANINKDLEEKMDYAQKISSLILSLRKKENIRVRQPLQKILVPIIDEKFARQITDVAELIKSEVNVKEIETIAPDSGFLVKTIKPNFKALGPKVGKYMKQVSSVISGFSQEQISTLEQNREIELLIENETISISLSDAEITSQDIPGWLVANEGKITVALDITISENLKEEGIAREFVNRIQNLRKDSGLEVTDKIALKIKTNNHINSAIENNKKYICTETLANKLELVSELEKGIFVDLGDGIETTIALEKINEN
jgi:isoleucyl-tRNA synthetase